MLSWPRPHLIIPIHILPVVSGTQKSLNPKQLEKESFFSCYPGIVSSKLLLLSPQPDVSFAYIFELEISTLLQIFGKLSHSSYLTGGLIL